MGILDGIVEWIAEQVMNGLDLITTSVLGALGCSMDTFLRYFPAAETMYTIFVATAIGLILLNWVWQLFKNFGLIAGIEAEDPFRLSIRSVLFIMLVYYCSDITDLILEIGGTPYSWIMTSDLPPISFADFNSVLLSILGTFASGSIALIALILLLILAWNYIKLLFEAAERYVLLGVLVYTAPMAFSTGSSKATGNVFSSWCRMFAGQVFLLIMNAWCLRIFTSMVGSFIANPLSIGSDSSAGNAFIWFLCAIAFLKISQKIDSFMSILGINVGHTGGSMMAELMIAARGLTSVKNISTGGSFRGGSMRGGSQMSNASHMKHASFLSGGLAGAASRQFSQSAMHTVTGQSSNPITRKAFDSSVKKGGEFANGVTGAVAQGNISYTGSMSGLQASQALTSYLGQNGIPDAPSYTDVEIGGGRIMGSETSLDYPNGTPFAMYSTEQYMAPENHYDTVTTADHASWYRQYAADAVERTPYMTEKGQIAYHEEMVQKLPQMPKRKDRV